MTDKERTEAWLNLPAEMRRELADLCRSHTISHNTRLRIEKIFGRENVNRDGTETPKVKVDAKKWRCYNDLCVNNGEWHLPPDTCDKALCPYRMPTEQTKKKK